MFRVVLCFFDPLGVQSFPVGCPVLCPVLCSLFSPAGCPAFSSLLFPPVSPRQSPLPSSLSPPVSRPGGCPVSPASLSTRWVSSLSPPVSLPGGCPVSPASLSTRWVSSLSPVSHPGECPVSPPVSPRRSLPASLSPRWVSSLLHPVSSSLLRRLGSSRRQANWPDPMDGKTLPRLNSRATISDIIFPAALNGQESRIRTVVCWCKT